MKINITASLNFILDLQISKKIPFLFASLIELKKSVKIDRSSRFRKKNKWNVVIDRVNNKVHLSSIKLRDAPLLRAVYLRLQLPHLNIRNAFQYWHHDRHTSQMLWLQTKSGATQILNRRWPAASGIYRDVVFARGNVEKGNKRRRMRTCTHSCTIEVHDDENSS